MLKLSYREKELAERSKLTIGSSKFESLRTTVPRSVVKNLNLRRGDYVEWDMVIENNKVSHYTVKKVEKSKK
jgi:hypothetical protein